MSGENVNGVNGEGRASAHNAEAPGNGANGGYGDDPVRGEAEAGTTNPSGITLFLRLQRPEDEAPSYVLGNFLTVLQQNQPTASFIPMLPGPEAIHISPIQPSD